MSDGRNIKRNEQKDGSIDWFQAPVFLHLLHLRGNHSGRNIICLKSSYGSIGTTFSNM